MRRTVLFLLLCLTAIFTTPEKGLTQNLMYDRETLKKLVGHFDRTEFKWGLTKDGLESYVNRLLSLQELGVTLNRYLLENFPPKITFDQEFMDFLREYSGFISGEDLEIAIRFYIKPLQVSARELRTPLLILTQEKIKFNVSFLVELAELKFPEKIEGVMRNLIRLKEVGVEVDRLISSNPYTSVKFLSDENCTTALLTFYKRIKSVDIGKIIDSLSFSRCRTDYIHTLLLLIEAGAPLGHTWELSYENIYSILVSKFVRCLSKEQALNQHYVAGLLRLYRSGIRYSGMPCEVTLERGVIPEYIDTVIWLHHQGVDFNKFPLYSLSPEKARSRKFLALAMKHNNNVAAEIEYVLRENPGRENEIKIAFQEEHYRISWGKIWESVSSYVRPDKTYNVQALERVILWFNETKDELSRAFIKERLPRLIELPVDRMNELQLRSEREREKVIEGASAPVLYYLISEARELYTATMEILAKKLKQELKKEGLGLLELTERVDPSYEYFSRFAYALSSHYQLGNLMEDADAHHTKEFFSRLVEKIADSSNKLEHAFYLGAGLGSILRGQKSSAAYSLALTQELVDWEARFRKKGFGQEETLLGIVISLYADFFDDARRERAMELRKKFNVSADEVIDPRELTDRNGVLHQRVFFYDDEDSASSFRHFIAQRRDSGWRVEELKDFAIITAKSPNPLSAIREIRIYANKPGAAKTPLSEYLEKARIEPKSVVHRGHNLHVRDTLSYLSGKEKMVFIGSCGGFRETDTILNKNLNTLIFSTAGVGTMTVNDPLFDAVDRAMLAGETNLRRIWERALAKIGDPRKREYIAPYENIGPKIYKAYKKFTAVDNPRVAP